MLGPHQDASYVFKSFQNGGNWPTQGLSCMVGLVGSVWSFVGADGAVHMSEEIKNASIVVPRSILSSIAVNGSLGFGIIIATLFCIGDPQAAENTLTDYPFMEIFAQATGSVGGASFMVAIVIVMQISADVALLASGSRMLWSFARDRGLPAWRTLARVDPRTSIPLISIILTMIINCLLSLIVLGSSTAFNNFVSIGVIGLQSSYFAAASLLLYRRCTGGIRLSKTADDGVINTIDAQMVWGPWRVPGFWGVAVNIFACIYMIIIMFFTLWPPKLPVTADNMNYSILLIGAVVFFSVVWYHVSAKKQYTGPVIEVLGARRN
ncbi:MAG: hypothetical protein M1820_008332 [Bogoriella megaspora]|nr:MAG: hypothetical protein M1820_008332 [Bogoriella megaspora]